MPTNLDAERAWGPAALTAAVMIAAQVGGKATRDAVFLSAFDASELPKAMLTAAVLSAAGVVAMSQGLARLGPARVVPVLFGVSAVTYGLEWWLLPRVPGVASVVVYLHVATLGSLLISGFWSVVNERFDPHTARRFIGRINAGAAIGGLIGGITAERVATWLDARSMLLLLGGMHVAAALSCLYTARGTPRSTAVAASALDGFKAFRETPYLRLLAALAALTALTSGVVDYAFKAQAAASHDTREGLMSIFAIFYTATSLVTVVAQTALSRRLLGRLGIGGTVAILPVFVVGFGTLALAFTRFWTFVATAAAEQVLSNSLYRSGYELLFTPLAPAHKRPTKALIDVGFDRAGGAIGSALMLGVVAFQPRYSALAAVALGVLASAGALLVALRLHRGYVEELARSLRTGRVTLSDSEIVDATTRRTLADTTMALDREQLLREIELLRKEQPPPSSRVASTPSPSTQSDPIVARLEDLLSGDTERIQRALKPPIDRRLVAYFLPLLGDSGHARAARRVLMQLAPKVVGQLLDALLDPDTPPQVRRRLPEIVAQARGARAAGGLFLALSDGERVVRERACAALSELVRADATLAPPRERVLEAAQREIAHLDTEPSALPHVFRILGLSFDSEALELSLAALRSDDARLRGTSYEYLENVLPDAVRSELWPKLKAFARAAPPPRGPRRSQRELADELRRSREAIRIDRDALRKP